MQKLLTSGAAPARRAGRLSKTYGRRVLRADGGSVRAPPLFPAKITPRPAGVKRPPAMAGGCWNGRGGCPAHIASDGRAGLRRARSRIFPVEPPPGTAGSPRPVRRVLLGVCACKTLFRRVRRGKGCAARRFSVPAGLRGEDMDRAKGLFFRKAPFFTFALVPPVRTMQAAGKCGSGFAQNQKIAVFQL